MEAGDAYDDGPWDYDEDFARRASEANPGAAALTTAAGLATGDTELAKVGGKNLGTHLALGALGPGAKKTGDALGNTAKGGKSTGFFSKLADSVSDVFNRLRGKKKGANAQSGVDLLSHKAKKHILHGDGPGSGGHLWPGQPGKTPIPKSWDADKIVHEVSDIITDPKAKWYAQTGSGGPLTKSGKPARWVSWEVRNGVRSRTVYEPATGEVITAFPDPSTPIEGIPIP